MGIIELIDWTLGYIISNFFTWYAHQIHFNFDIVTIRVAFLEIPIPQFIFKFPNTLLFLFIIFLIVQVLFMILPGWVEKIVKGTCFYFTLLHGYAHVQTVKELQSEIKKTQNRSITRMNDQTKKRTTYAKVFY